MIQKLFISQNKRDYDETPFHQLVVTGLSPGCTTAANHTWNDKRSERNFLNYQLKLIM